MLNPFSAPPEKTYCPHPFTNLNSNTDGRVKLCCSIVENDHLRAPGGKELNFRADTLDAIWNGEQIRRVRREMLRGERPPECGVCWKLEDRGLRSSRASALDGVRDQPAEKAWKLTAADGALAPGALPVSLELRLGTLCNLKCSSCWSLSSSAVRAERETILTDAEATLPAWLRDSWKHEIAMATEADKAWFESEEFMTTFRQAAPGLRRLYLTGGEPTLIRRNLDFVRHLVDIGNRDCEVSFTTNLTHWNDELYGLLGNFRCAEVQASIDGVGELGEMIRYPSRWETVSANFQKLVRLPSSVRLKVFTVVQATNSHGIAPLLHWLRDQDVRRPLIFAPIPLEAPSFLSAGILAEHKRHESADAIFRFLAEWRDSPAHQIWIATGAETAALHIRGASFPEAELASHRRNFCEYLGVLHAQRGVSRSLIDLVHSGWEGAHGRA